MRLSRARTLCVLTFLLVRACFGAGSGTCPAVCTCKWKNGKQTVECMDRALITIPESVDSETQVLNMSGNNLQILPRETFLRAGLLNLQRIFLRNCRIGQIDDLAFRGLTNVIELDLSHNLLTSVPSGTFQDVPFLRDLVLSHNPIQKIDGRAFRTVPGLGKLDLSHCEIQSVAPKAFDGVDLLELKLNGNRLTELRLQTVQSLSRLHGVELQENPWHCDCRMRPVKEWLTHHNIPMTIVPTCAGGPERVLHKTFSELHVDDYACKPDILPTSRYVEANTGDNITVVCKANAVPAAHINWYWNGRLLVNNSAFSSHQKIFIFEDGNFQKHSHLVLTNAQETDSSEFYCVAENRAGNAEANFTVRVSMRAAGMVTLGSGQIAGLSAALVILILFILLVVLVLLVRLRRMPFSESKTPGQIEVVTVVNGSAIPNGKSGLSPTTPTIGNETAALNVERKIPGDLNFCNPVQKPPRLNDSISYTTSHYNGTGSVMNPGSCFVSPSSGSGNNPDLINDTRGLEDGTATTSSQGGSGDSYGVETATTMTTSTSTSTQDRPGSGEYNRNVESLYPSGFWDVQQGDSVADTYARLVGSANPGFHFHDDKTPIIFGETNDETNRSVGYPQDYGLPMVDPSKTDGSSSMVFHNHHNNSATTPPTNAKTLRVWQKGGVPVLPPVTALKRALTHSRNSPDEGYQEGCGTDV